MAFSFLFLEAMALVRLHGMKLDLWAAIGLGLAVILSLAFLIGNELVLRTLKRVAASRIDPMLMEKLALVMPVVSGVLVMVVYLLTGEAGVILFGVVATIQAYMCGYRWLAKTTLATSGGVFLVGMLFHEPVGMATGTAGALWLLMTFVPLALTLNHYGRMAHSLMRTTSDKVEILQSLAAIDGLTGLINRRQFNNQLLAEISRARRSRKPLSLALFDIDDFKKINDFYGHPVGDRILKELGDLVTKNVRESDVPARYGGEEFALILPETKQIEAFEILERLRQLIEHTVYCLPDNPMTISVSVGVAQLDLDQATAFDLVERADAALYEAKRQGKNRVVYGVLPTPKLNVPYDGNPGYRLS